MSDEKVLASKPSDSNRTALIPPNHVILSYRVKQNQIKFTEIFYFFLFL